MAGRSGSRDVRSRSRDVRSGSRDVRRQSIAQSNSRYFDVPTEIDNDTNPIEGYQKKPLQSLSRAVEDVDKLVSNVKSHARNAEIACRQPCSDGLTLDQSAAISLYTMEWEPQKMCLYFVLNQTLRNKDRNKLKPWFAYLKLILTGLFQLESITSTVYRGVKLDLHLKYPVGETIIWWSFSSCTDDLATLQSEQFLGKKGPRTIFIIKCCTGKNISRHSRFPREGEILLLPATKFIVKSLINAAPDLYMIELSEVPSSHILLEPPCENIDTHLNCELDSVLSTSLCVDLDLTKKNLHDRDMAPICKNLRSNIPWVSLDLSANNITLDGAIHINNALRINQTLKTLNLSDNQLTDFGVTTLAHGLYVNKTLESITLSLNQVTDKGVDSIVDMLHQNSTIMYLDLSSNEISDCGVHRLTSLLIQRNHLKQLFLNDNKATDDSVQDVMHILDVNRSLVTLYLHGNQFSEQSKERIHLTRPRRNDFTLSL